MKFGLTQDQFKYLQKNVIEPIKKTNSKLWIFGSRARGDHQEFSDIDLMVDSTDDHSSLIGLINEALEEGNFPFKVDIIQLKDYAQSYLETYLKDRIEL
jgi:predicted nucleotidyltransferase